MDATFIVGSGNARFITNLEQFKRCMEVTKLKRIGILQVGVIGNEINKQSEAILKWLKRCTESIKYIMCAVEDMAKCTFDAMKDTWDKFKLKVEDYYYPEEPWPERCFEKQIFERPHNITCNYVPKISKHKAWFTMVRRRV